MILRFRADRYWYYAYEIPVRMNNNNNYTILDENDYPHGGGARVKHCALPIQNTINSDILINSSLRANREMSFNLSNGWMNDTTI